MKAFLESLSLDAGAVLVAGLSMDIVWLLCRVFPFALRILWVLIVPFILAYSIYWMPVWFGADASEYVAWAWVVWIWFFAGFFPSSLLVLILQKRRAKRQPS
jgi:hypothetical protein